MNLRIEEGGIRFRITPDILAQLLNGMAVSRTIRIGPENFSYEIRLLPEGDPKLKMSAGRLVLSVPPGMLRQLSDLGRSKDGLVFRQGDNEIYLQVDLKSQLRRAV